MRGSESTFFKNRAGIYGNKSLSLLLIVVTVMGKMVVAEVIVMVVVMRI